MTVERYACPCCGYKTLTYKERGSYEICHVCRWEDDGVQFDDPDFEGGANQYSLRQAQSDFLSQFQKEKVETVRLPLQINGYVYEGPKDISQISRMPIMELVKIFSAIGVPLEKVMDLYGGAVDVGNSRYVFSYEELDDYLQHDDIIDYFTLIHRQNHVKVPNGEGRHNELLNMSDGAS